MICTAPTIPPCTNEATFALLNAQSRSHLGCNCDAHLAPLLVAKKGTQPDYATGPLPAQEANPA